MKIIGKREINKSDDAVVGIVVTVLLIGLFLSIIIMVNTMYVPQWLENSESSHMEDVSNQFTQLKYALDIQTTVNDSTAMTIPVTLGTKEIPFFDAGRTFDTLEIIKDAVTIDFTPGGSYTSDAIIFSSGNMYFVDQSLIYEAGILIKSQNEKSVLYGSVPILITEYGHNITFYITDIEGLDGKTHASGQGTYPIYTKAPTPIDEALINNVTQITITTAYPQAWKTTLSEALGDASGFSYDLSTNGNVVTLQFNIVDNNILVKNKNIVTQIAFGLAE